MWKAKLRQLIKIGRLKVIAPDGASVTMGGDAYAPHHRALDVTVRLHGALTPLKLAIDPNA